MVSNHGKDAEEIERRLSTGNGLLADGGASIDNMFSGDAPITRLTMSKVGTDQDQEGARGASTTSCWIRTAWAERWCAPSGRR